MINEVKTEIQYILDMLNDVLAKTNSSEASLNEAKHCAENLMATFAEEKE